MKIKARAVCCFAAALLFCGCAQEAAPPPINVVDAGDYSIGESADTAPGESVPADNAAAEYSERGDNADTSREAESASEAATSESSPDLPQEAPTEPSDTERPAPFETSRDTESTKPTEPSAAESSASSESSSATETTTTDTAPEPVSPPEEIGTSSYKALNYDEVRGVWISYIELSEMLTGKTESEFRTAVGTAFDNCKALGLNTVYVHARSHSDAYYRSSLFPWSKYCTGTAGKAPAFDPLAVMVEEAHARKLSFQAWINPLRACPAGDTSAQSGYKLGEWISEKAGDYIVNVGGTYYLNPAYDEVTRFIAQGAAEIAANYDVDGIHIDDYFYPTTDASFDSRGYSASGYTTLSAFRFANCDRLVKCLYSAVKSANSTALFGVSCQGSMDNNYNQMYADVKKWCTESGYTDYIMPQIYYGFENSTQPFERCTSEWSALAQSGKIPLIVGLSASKIGLEDTWAGAGKQEWKTEENILARQFLYAYEQPAYGGVCLYSYRSIFTPEAAVRAQVEKETHALKNALSQ